MATPTNTPATNPNQSIPVELYDTNMGDISLDVSPSNRMFQNSVIVTQDPAKEGVLSLLIDRPQGLPSLLTPQSTGTMRPTQRQGGY